MADNKKKPLILASSSPRRKQLLKMAGLHFTQQSADIPEIVPDGMAFERQSEYLAAIKAGFVLSRQDKPCIVIGSDTTVVCGGRLLGKPKTKEEAAEMLHFLSGKTHTVYTGVAMMDEDKTVSFTSATEVEFYALTDQEIDDYIATGDPMDKAGAYGIQGVGCRLVKGIRGDYYTVMGLPVAEVVRRLEGF